jgi:hypothetical protein
LSPRLKSGRTENHTVPIAKTPAAAQRPDASILFAPSSNVSIMQNIVSKSGDRVHGFGGLTNP